MHPADLADHRARRDRAAARSLEREAARLAPRVDAGERLALHILCDATRRGDLPQPAAAAFIRARISQLDRDENTKAA